MPVNALIYIYIFFSLSFYMGSSLIQFTTVTFSATVIEISSVVCGYVHMLMHVILFMTFFSSV